MAPEPAPTAADRRYPPPPSGLTPPATAPGSDGREIDLVAPAQRAWSGFARETPDYVARYGTVGGAWFVHDCRHLLDWALTRSTAGFERQLDWLTRVLAGRDFSLDQFARGIELLAEEAGREPGMQDAAARLAAGAARVRGREALR